MVGGEVPFSDRTLTIMSSVMIVPSVTPMAWSGPPVAFLRRLSRVKGATLSSGAGVP